MRLYLRNANIVSKDVKPSKLYIDGEALSTTNFPPVDLIAHLDGSASQNKPTSSVLFFYETSIPLTSGNHEIQWKGDNLISKVDRFDANTARPVNTNSGAFIIYQDKKKFGY